MGNLKVAVFMREISVSISARFTPHFVTLLLETFRGLLCGTSLIPHYGLRRVLCVGICGTSGMCSPMAATTGKSMSVVLRNLFQPILTCTTGA